MTTPSPGFALLRWLAVVPAVGLSWLAGLVAGLGLLSLAERQCDPEDMVSGMCTAPWYEVAQAAILCGCTALAAALMVASAAWAAPSRKRAVAGVVLALGVAYAIFGALETGAWAAGLSALAAGALAFAIVARRARPPG